MDKQPSGRTVKPVGELVIIKFPIGISVALTILVLLSGIIFWCYPKFRDELTFFGIAFGMAGGVIAAYYIGQTLKITVQQRDEQLDADRINTAFSYIHRWNAAPFDDRHKFRALMYEVKSMPPKEVTAHVEGDHEAKSVVTDVMNFFEEMSLAINEGLADDETARKFFNNMLEYYYQRFADWIHMLRTDGGGSPRPSVYIQLENVIGRWRHSN